MVEVPELRVCVLGEGGVGKTSLVIRYVSDRFDPDYDPYIEDSYRKMVDIDGEPIILDILDTYGQEEFAAMNDLWIRESQCFLLCYAINRRGTFDTVQEFADRIERIKEDELDEIVIVIVGCKVDLERDQREVALSEVDTLMTRMQSTFSSVSRGETSAKENTHVTQCMEQLVRDYRSQRDRNGMNRARNNTWKIDRPRKKVNPCEVCCTLL